MPEPDPQVVVRVSVEIPAELGRDGPTVLSREITATPANVRSAGVDLIDQLLQEAVLDVRDQLSRSRDG